MYDTETDLYYMHARYYDPEAGRFIMKDPVEGSLGSPITQNSYIYCANDPVNKIDPAGTVTLGALDNPFKPKPPSKNGPPDVIPPPSKPPNCYNTCGSNMTVITPNGLPGNKCRNCIGAGFASSLTGEECGETICQIEGDDLYAYYLTGGGTSDDPTSASTVLSGGLEDLTRCSILPDSGIIEQPNKDYNIKWEMDEYGNVKLSAVDKAGNPVKLSPEDQDVLNSLEKGMNDALNWLEEEGFIKTFSVFLPGIFHLKVLGFISKYSSMFYRIVGGVTPENAYELGYNATIGVAISYQMVQYSEKSFNDFDSEIGFWTSYWSRKSGLVYNKNSNRSGMHFYGDAKHLGLLDVANLSKAIIYRESTFDPDAHRGDSNGFKGLMGVAYEGSDADYDFIGQFGGPTGFAKTGADFYKPFNNIGMGVGMLFGKLASSSTYLYSEGHREAPTAQQWWEAVTYYYGKTNPDGSIDIIACEEYANGVWSLFRTGYDQLGNQIWSIESQNWVKYYGNYKNWWDSKGWVMPIW